MSNTGARMKIDGRQVTSVNCNLCDQNHNEIIWEKDSFKYRKCKKCGLVFISPRLTSKEISKIYEIGFDSKSSTTPPPLDHTLYSKLFKKAEKYRMNNNFLDIGCFRGDFLVGAKNLNWNVYGTEISEEAVKYGKNNYDIKIELGSLLDASFKNNYFDVITLLDVVEHLTDPSEYLIEIERILRPGGLLYLDTPNFNSLNRYIFGKKWSVFFPWHLFYFTSKTLKNICIKNNLQVIKITNEDWGPFSTHNVYKNLTKSKEIVNKRRGLKVIVLKFRKQLKPVFRIIKFLINIPLKILSFFGIYIGSKSILLAEKPR